MQMPIVRQSQPAARGIMMENSAESHTNSTPNPARLARLKRKPNRALEGFDKLPDSAYVRVDVVSDLRNCSNATTWRHAAAGIIPAPKKLSAGITAWNVGELRACLAAAGESMQ